MQSFLRVITPADSYSLTTVAAVRADLSLPDNTNDDYIRETIAQVSASISNYCNRVFQVETVSEVIRLKVEPDYLEVKRFPIVTVSAITIDGVDQDLANFEIDEGKGRIYKLDSGGDPISWSKNTKVVVSYTGGYATLPEAVSRAALDMVKMRHFSRIRDPLVKSENISGVIQTDYWVGTVGEQVGGLPSDIATIVDPYRVYYFE